MKLKSLFWGSLFLLMTGATSWAQTKTVWISSKVAVDLTLGNSLSGQTITFNLKDASGKALGQATVPASQALGSALSTFFQSVSDGIRELIGGGPQDTSAGGSLITISVSETGTTVANLGGNVTITDGSGNVSKIDVGTGLVLKSDGTKSTQSLADIVKAEKAAGTSGNANSVTAALTQAMQKMADNVKSGSAGDTGLAQLSALTKVLAAANPESAADFVKTAVDAATSSTSGVKNASNAITALVEAASGSLTTEQIQQVQTAAAAAGTANGVANAATAASLGASRATSTDPDTGSTTPPASTPVTNIPASPS